MVILLQSNRYYKPDGLASYKTQRTVLNQSELQTPAIFQRGLDDEGEGVWVFGKAQHRADTQCLQRNCNLILSLHVGLDSTESNSVTGDYIYMLSFIN